MMLKGRLQLMRQPLFLPGAFTWGAQDSNRQVVGWQPGKISIYFIIIFIHKKNTFTSEYKLPGLKMNLVSEW
jgi:hypothetical protein